MSLKVVANESDGCRPILLALKRAIGRLAQLPPKDQIVVQKGRSVLQLVDSLLRHDTVQSRHLYALHGLNDYLPLRQMLQGCLRNPHPVSIPKEHLTFAALIRAI
ncbi:hypothetical protein TNCV_1891601 [Trichonephila clavipes]|nr:hypothetical protein TNCV_1891601 [Trichonephila clavipes]